MLLKIVSSKDLDRKLRSESLTWNSSLVLNNGGYLDSWDKMIRTTTTRQLQNAPFRYPCIVVKRLYSSHLTRDEPDIFLLQGEVLPHIRPLSTEPGLQKRKAFSVSNELLSATRISDESWKEYMGSWLRVLSSWLVMVSKVLMSRCWFSSSRVSFLSSGSGTLAEIKTRWNRT